LETPWPYPTPRRVTLTVLITLTRIPTQIRTSRSAAFRAVVKVFAPYYMRGPLLCAGEGRSYVPAPLLICEGRPRFEHDLCPAS
jgi:hypothetical protein